MAKKLAFIFGAYREDLGPVPKAGPFVAVQVQFEGRFSGVLELRLSEAVLPELAANMLGVDDSGLVGIGQQQRQPAGSDLEWRIGYTLHPGAG